MKSDNEDMNAITAPDGSEGNGQIEAVKNMKNKTPQFRMEEEWVQEYIRQNGEEPTFF